MRERIHRASRDVRLSTLIYSRLLVLYPQAFRREYGAHMVQVFRDCCREALHTNGITGLWHYWVIALGDLVVSVFAERRRQEFSMSRTTWIRLGSLAAIIAGGVAAFSSALDILIATLRLINQNSALVDALFGVHVLGLKVLPEFWLFNVLALIGLHARGVSRVGRIGWVTISIAILGEIIFGVGSEVQVYLLIFQSGGCSMPFTCSYYDPNNYLAMSITLILLGWSIFVFGMLLYGVTALRSRVLPRLNWLPLSIGVSSLLFVTGGFAVQFVNNYPDPLKITIFLNVIALIPAIAWILLGAAMWPRTSEEPIAQAAI